MTDNPQKPHSATVSRRLLLIEGDPIDREIVQRYLHKAAPGIFDLVMAESLRRGLEHLASERFAVVLLDRKLPDSAPETILAHVRALATTTPIIVLTGLGGFEDGLKLVHEGAQDFLVKGSFDAELLARVVRHAIERAALLQQIVESEKRERRERELRQLVELNVTEESSQSRLRSSAPVYFEEAARRYRRLLAQAVELTIYRHEDAERAAFRKDLRTLADELGKLRCGPGDLVELHGKAIRDHLHSQRSDDAQAWIEEGRMVLIEVLGNLVQFYRGRDANG